MTPSPWLSLSATPHPHLPGASLSLSYGQPSWQSGVPSMSVSSVGSKQGGPPSVPALPPVAPPSSPPEPPVLPPAPPIPPVPLLPDVVEPALPVVLDVEEEFDVVCMLVEPALPATPPLPPRAPPSPRTIVVLSSPMHAAAKRAANESAQKARTRMRLSISMVGLS